MRLAVLLGIGFLVSFAAGRWAGTPSEINAAARAPALPLLTISASRLATAQPSLQRDPAATPPRLADALAIEDPLASAAQALAWIEAATIEDFRQLAADPEAFPLPEFRAGFKQECRRALHDALFDRWFRIDSDAALAAVLRLDDAWRKANRTDTGQLLATVARVRPELVLESQLNGEAITQLSKPMEVAFEALAARDAPAARRYLQQISDAAVRRSAEIIIEQRLARVDPLAAVAAAKKLKHQSLYWVALQSAQDIGPGMLRQVIASIGSDYDTGSYLSWLLLKEPEAIAELPGAREAKIHDVTLKALANQTTPEDRERFLASYEKLPEALRADAGAAMASGWARTEPEKAAESALTHARPEDREHPENRAVDQAFRRWVKNAPESALSWWRALPASPLRNALGASASTYVAEGGDLDLALEIMQPGASKAEEGTIGRMGQLLAERDPLEAADWLRALPPEAESKIAARLVVEALHRGDPTAAARWVEEFPAGCRRDEVAVAFIGQAALRSPDGAAEWVRTVDDPTLRQDAALAVYERWRESDPAAANSWMRALDGVDSEWHARFVRMMR